MMHYKAKLSIIVLLFLFSTSSFAQNEGFIVLGDIHFDKFEYHDLDYLRTRPQDYRQVFQEYPQYSAFFLPDFLKVIKKKAISNNPPIKAVAQLGDLVQGVSGNGHLSRQMNRGVVDLLHSVDLDVPWVLAKGNHDVSNSPGQPEAWSIYANAIKNVVDVIEKTKNEPELVNYWAVASILRAYEISRKGGKLQCLAIKEWKSADTRNWEDLKTDKFPEKELFQVEWIDLDNVEAPDNDLRIRAFEKGGTRFAAAEGIWYGNDELFFACTSGGHNHKGQIFRYVPSKFEGQPEEKNSPGQIELFLEPNNLDTFQSCDSLTIAPWGDVFICEDKADPRIIGITPKGERYVIAKNIGYRESEFAGPVFSPSGDTLFVNIQSPGLTIAITGPWSQKQHS